MEGCRRSSSRQLSTPGVSVTWSNNVQPQEDMSAMSPGTRARYLARVKASVDSENTAYLALLAKRMPKDMHKLNLAALERMQEDLRRRKPLSPTQPTCASPEARPSEKLQSPHSPISPQYPHPRPFRWPALRPREEILAHPKKPHPSRIEDLREPWVEDPVPKLGRAEHDPSLTPFRTIVAPPHGKEFGKDPEFFRSIFRDTLVHLEKEHEEAVRAEREAWKAKVVVESEHMDLVTKFRLHPSQTDRYDSIVHDPPKKLGISGRSLVEQPPLSMYLEEPWVENKAFANGDPPEDPQNFTNKGVDFKRYINTIRASRAREALG